MTILFIFLNLASEIFYKTFFKAFTLFFNMCLVKTIISDMTHICDTVWASELATLFL